MIETCVFIGSNARGNLGEFGFLVAFVRNSQTEREVRLVVSVITVAHYPFTNSIRPDVILPPRQIARSAENPGHTLLFRPGNDVVSEKIPDFAKVAIRHGERRYGPELNDSLPSKRP